MSTASSAMGFDIMVSVEPGFNGYKLAWTIEDFPVFLLYNAYLSINLSS